MIHAHGWRIRVRPVSLAGVCRTQPQLKLHAQTADTHRLAKPPQCGQARPGAERFPPRTHRQPEPAKPGTQAPARPARSTRGAKLPRRPALNQRHQGVLFHRFFHFLAPTARVLTTQASGRTRPQPAGALPVDQRPGGWRPGPSGTDAGSPIKEGGD